MKLSRVHFADPICKPGAKTAADTSFLSVERDGVELDLRNDGRLYITKGGYTVIVPDGNVLCAVAEAPAPAPAKAKP